MRTSRRKTLNIQSANPCSALCVGAIRGSTERQRLTIPTQGAAIDRYCELKGLEHVADFIDSGTCGKTPWLQRENTRAMLNLMAERGIQQIVYTRLDRAFRSTSDAILTIHKCLEHGLKIHFCEQDIDPNTPMGKAMAAMIAVFAELETDLRLQRQIETFDEMRVAQYKAGINVPYGWDKVASPARVVRSPRRGRKDCSACRVGNCADHDMNCGNDVAFDLVPNWIEQEYLREILRRHQEGESDGQIALLLNASGVPTKKGKRWRFSTVFSVRSFARVPRTAV